LARFAVADQVVLNTRFEYVWTHEQEHPAINNQWFSVLANGFVPGSFIPIVSSTGWQATVGATAKF